MFRKVWTIWAVKLWFFSTLLANVSKKIVFVIISLATGGTWKKALWFWFWWRPCHYLFHSTTYVLINITISHEMTVMFSPVWVIIHCYILTGGFESWRTIWNRVMTIPKHSCVCKYKQNNVSIWCEWTEKIQIILNCISQIYAEYV
jgi:hypothetical protein